MKNLLLFSMTLAAACYGGKKNPQPRAEIPSKYLEKAIALYQHKNDSSFFYFNQAANKSRDSQQIVYAYNYMAIIQQEEGDFFGSQETVLEALKLLDRNNKSHYYSLYSVYTVLANTFVDLKNYDAAIRYCDSALKFSNDKSQQLYPLNTLALAYQKKGAYENALKIYSVLLDSILGNKKEYARILSNIARTKWLQDTAYNPLPEFLTAVRIRQAAKDDWGLNASYAHLSDYYFQSRPDSALYFASKMYETATSINSPGDRLEAVQKLIPLVPEKDIKSYVNLFQHLNDSIETVKNNARNQFAIFRYDAERSKAENLALQKENAEKGVQLSRQWIILIFIVFTFLIIAIIATNRYKKRKQRMKWESENAVRETKLRMSQKVHDVVANGIYNIMAVVEHEPCIQKEQLLDKLEVLYEKSRDISYEKAEKHTGFQGLIADMLTSFEDPTTKVFIVGNKDEFWATVSSNKQNELQHILRELMVNMKKHSQAKNVVVKFEQVGTQIVVQYTDDGIGLQPSFQYGNGLISTGNRIKDMNGHITFEKTSSKGLKIRISFPTP